MTSVNTQSPAMAAAATSAAGATANVAPAAGIDKAGLKKAAQQFEAIFIRQMMSSMRSASLGEDLLGSSAGDQFRDMSDARTADSMAEKGALGIAQLLIAQFEHRATPDAGVPPMGQAATISKETPANAVNLSR